MSVERKKLFEIFFQFFIKRTPRIIPASFLRYLRNKLLRYLLAGGFFLHFGFDFVDAQSIGFDSLSLFYNSLFLDRFNDLSTVIETTEHT